MVSLKDDCSVCLLLSFVNRPLCKHEKGISNPSMEVIRFTIVLIAGNEGKFAE